jgi:signal transduction histidine kinase
MKFSSAIIKLTVSYAVIVMVISIGFSIAIFQISTQEIDRGLGNQTLAIRQLPDSRMIPFGQRLDQIREQESTASSNRLSTNLIYFNLLILLLSATGSYLLARRTLKPIEEMLESQQRFTADASHELKTPLTAMRTEIEVNLRDKAISADESRALLESNLEEIGKLETLSSALLKLTRYSEEVKVEFSKISLSEVVVEAYNKVKSIADEKNITIVLKGISESKEVSILGDKQSLVELFVILFDNAIKYSPRDTKVQLSVTSLEKRIKIAIKDNGIGIKASDIPHIFDRFYRADHSRSKDQVSGYGLGLSIAKRIVDLHRGKISVTSSPSHGSEFALEFNK